MTTGSWGLFAAFAAAELILRVFFWLPQRKRDSPGDLAIGSYSALSVLTVGVVIGVSVVDSLVGIAKATPGRMAAGVLLCVLALAIRYTLPAILLLAKHSRSRGHGRRYTDMLWALQAWYVRVFPMRHPRYVGLVAELAALSAILGSPIGVGVALGIAPLVLLQAVEHEEKRMLARSPDSLVAYDRERKAPLRPPIYTAGMLLVPPGLLYLFIALPTGELRLFNSDAETARWLLLSVAGAQGTWAILALSLSLVLMQILSSSYSPSLARLAGIRWPLVAALALLVTSVTYDVVVVARINDWITGASERGGTLVDAGLLTAFLSLASVTAAAFLLTRDVAPDRLASRLLRRFDTKWCDSTARNWSERDAVRHIDPDDPARALEDMLRSLSARGDVTSMWLVLHLLCRRLDDISRAGFEIPNHKESSDFRRQISRRWIAFDAKLHYFMSPLVRAIGRSMDKDALAHWLEVVTSTQEHVDLERDDLKRLGPMMEKPPGEALLREIISTALDNSNADVAIRGIYGVKGRGNVALALLPAEQETFLYNPERDSQPNVSEQERTKLHENDWIVDGVVQSYVTYLGDNAVTAIRAGLRDVAWAASSALGELLSGVCKEVSRSPRIKTWFVTRILLSMRQIAEATCENRLRRAIALWSLHYAVDALDSEREEDAEIIVGLAAFSGEIVSLLAEHEVLDYTSIVDVAMVGLSAGRKIADAGSRVVQGMGEALDALPMRKDTAWLVEELGGRIRQVAINTKEEGDHNIIGQAKEILERHRLAGM